MKKIFTIILAAVMLLTALTACKPSSNPDATQIPSNATALPVEAAKATPELESKVTEQPTAEPTQGFLEANIPYDKKECEILRKFFDTPSGVEGLSNGKLLNPGYVSDDPSTWKSYEDRELLKDGDIFMNILWSNTGHVVTMAFGRWGEDFKVSYFPIVPLGGELIIDGFSELAYCRIKKSSFDKVVIRNCPKMEYLYLDYDSIPYVDVCYNSAYGSDFDSNATYIHWKCDGEFDIFDVTACAEDNGSKGSVSCSSVGDTHEVLFSVTAKPLEGYKFVGWYDENGNLISTDLRYYITPTKDTGSIVGTHNFTARFTEE